MPIYTNIFAPPLPRPERFVQLGRTIRELVESMPGDQRVAVIGTGHLSLELGGPRQFGPHGPDPEFDAKAVEWIATGDLETCCAEVTLDSLHAPGNATHGFMDFMLMMGVAGDGARADYVDNLDLFHTMEAYFTWYPNGAPTGGDGMSKYLLNKFLYTVDRDPELVERYRDDPAGTVTWWEAREGQRDPQLPGRRAVHLARASPTTERAALASHDYPALFELGAHPFLTLTLFIAMFERDHDQPLGFQLEYARAARGVLAALPGHRDLTCAPPSSTPSARHRRTPSIPTRRPARASHWCAVTAAPIVPLDQLCASGTSYFGAPADAVRAWGARGWRRTASRTGWPRGRGSGSPRPPG